MASEYSTRDGVLRQTITHHLQAIPLLTDSCAFDVMSVPAVITVTVVGEGAVHDVEVSCAAQTSAFIFFLRMCLALLSFTSR